MNSLYLPKAAAQLVERPGSRKGLAYWYGIDGEKYQRVTTILDKTVPKPALIPWARNTALADAEKAIRSFGYSGSALKWDDWVDQVMEHAKAEPDRVKDAAADWGTEAHGHIQARITNAIQGGGVVLNDDPTFQPTIRAFSQFAKSMSIQWRATELVVWSNQLRVAGTVDAVGQLADGAWVVFDWKTGSFNAEKAAAGKSGFFWPDENALQVAAYSALFTEVTGHPVDQAWVVRFPRAQPDQVDTPGFEARQVANLEGTALHYEMLVDHFRWLAASPWKDKED